MVNWASSVNWAPSGEDFASRDVGGSGIDRFIGGAAGHRWLPLQRCRFVNAPTGRRSRILRCFRLVAGVSGVSVPPVLVLLVSGGAGIACVRTLFCSLAGNGNRRRSARWRRWSGVGRCHLIRRPQSLIP